MYRAQGQPAADSLRQKANDGSRPGSAAQAVGAYRPEPPSTRPANGFNGRPGTAQGRGQTASTGAYGYGADASTASLEAQAYQPQQPWGAQPGQMQGTASQGRLAVDTYAASRPGTAQRKQGSDSGVSVYTNSMYDAGDILGGESNSHQQQSPMSPGSPAGGSQKMQQQRALAAQKRLERLQMNGVAQSNTDTGSRPSTAASARSMNSTERHQSAPGAPRVPHAASSSPALSSSLGGAGYSMDSSIGEQAIFPASPPKTGRADARLTTGRTAASETELALMAKGMATVYDPTEEGTAVRPTGEWGPRDGALPRAKVDVSNMLAFLTQPVARGQGPVMCYIEREKGTLKAQTYRLFLDDGRRFLLAAKKRKTSTSSNYMLSMDSEDLGRSSRGYIGKLRSNFVGTEFVVYDNGAKQGKGGSDGNARQELGAIIYDYNVLGTRGPRRMSAAIPAIDAVGRSRYKAANADDSLLARVKEQRHLGELLVLHNKPPKWNEQLNAYCLNFNGRVTEASVKNFQLVADEAPEHVVLQFGKVANATFTMDIQWPISPMQAFAICLSSFDNKLACE